MKQCLTERLWSQKMPVRRIVQVGEAEPLFQVVHEWKVEAGWIGGGQLPAELWENNWFFLFVDSFWVYCSEQVRQSCKIRSENLQIVILWTPLTSFLFFFPLKLIWRLFAAERWTLSCKLAHRYSQLNSLGLQGEQKLLPVGSLYFKSTYVGWLKTRANWKLFFFAYPENK